MSIVLDHVNYTYSAGTAYEKHALKDINLVIPDGQFIGLIGHTGSGKSTLIQHLNGLIKATSGAIYYDGHDIYDDDFSMKSLRTKVGLVFQYPEHQLFETTVVKDVEFGPKNMKLPQLEVQMRTFEAIKMVGISEELYDASPFELSGGQKRRVAIAGVLAMKPQVLVLDEPTAGLDPTQRIRLRDYIASVAKERTVLLATHVIGDIETIAKKVLLLHHGTLCRFAPIPELLSETEELMKEKGQIPEHTLTLEDVYLFHAEEQLTEN